MLFLAKDRGGFLVAICEYPGALVAISHIAARYTKRRDLFMFRGRKTLEIFEGAERLGWNVMDASYRA